MADHPPLGAAVPRLLAARGIDTVFGIPGAHTIELYRGLPGSGLRHVTPRHEQGAGFMADGYARVSGKPAACFVVTGPGLLNAATAMGQALADSVPMLVVTTLNPRKTLGRGEGRLHELRGQSAVAREISALALEVATADQLVPALDEAFAVFASGRPGPVVIELPIDLLLEPFAFPIGKPLAPPAPPGPDDGSLVAAAAYLNGAKRPLLIVGGGAVRGADDVRDLAERLGAPTLLTSNAKGILPPGHPLLAGGFLHHASIRSLVRDADVVLALGTELGETDFEWYGEGPLPFSGALVRVDIDPRQLLRNARPTLGLVSDVRQFADALIPLLITTDHLGADRARAAREAARAETEPRLLGRAPLVEALWRTLPEATLAGDSTLMSYAACLFAEAPAPRRFMSARTGFGTLGFALPAAIGAKIARPDAPAIALIGDGGLHFTLPELAAAADAGAPVIVLLWNDRNYGEIDLYMRQAGVDPVGVALYPTDFAAAAKAFGARHRRADSLGELETALAEAAREASSTIIEMDASRYAF
jgi:acetolactate synthase I/II/III large subunit